MVKNENEFELGGFYEMAKMTVSSLVAVLRESLVGFFLPLIFVSALNPCSRSQDVEN